MHSISSHEPLSVSLVHVNQHARKRAVSQQADCCCRNTCPEHFTQFQGRIQCRRFILEASCAADIPGCRIYCHPVNTPSRNRRPADIRAQGEGSIDRAEPAACSTSRICPPTRHRTESDGADVSLGRALAQPRAPAGDGPAPCPAPTVALH